MLDRADPRQPLEGDDAIGVLRLFLHQRFDRAIELVDGELEPQLMLLVDDDEQQLVVGAGLQYLRGKQPLQPEVTGVCILHGDGHPRESGGPGVAAQPLVLSGFPLSRE